MTHSRPLAIAHRGAHEDLPENSLAAIVRALDLGAQGVEIDVRATADGVLVLHHDPDLPDGRAIAAHTMKELLSSGDSARPELARLEDALDAVAGRAVLFIETKVAGIEFPLIRAVRASAADAAVHSFDHDTIRSLKLIMPALRAGVLTGGDASVAVDAAVWAMADDVWHVAADVDAELVTRCHRLGKQVIAWTENSADGVRRLCDLKVGGICTDDIPMVLRARDNHATLSARTS